MIVTLMVIAVVTALSLTVAVITINSLQSAWRAQQAGAAVNAADAGVDQAVQYLRSQGVRSLGCSPNCPANPWGDSNNPATVTVPGSVGQTYQVWIEAPAPYPANDPGRYTIHSIGSANGSARREVVADVEVSGSQVPKGVFARTISGGGDASVQRESIITTGCVYNRSKIRMEGTDLAYGIPAAVHSSQIITDSNSSGQYCPTTNKPIHAASQPCHPQYPHDQDRLGGSLIGTACEATQLAYPIFQPRGSAIADDATLLGLFGIRSPALTPVQIDELRTIAQSQGNYWTGATGWSDPDEANAVMFFDLTAADPNRRTVDLNDVDGFGRASNLSAGDPGCLTKSLIIVVEGGNVRLNSNQQLAASVFLTSSAPYGQVLKDNGTSNFIGTLYADTVNLTGTADISLDPCFLDNIGPALLGIRIGSYRELDR